MEADFSFDLSLSAYNKAPGLGQEKPTRLTPRINQKYRNKNSN
jgi:hypothetical protein